ncbi:hypothetical protein H5400_37520 [Rhodococcus wratislaviensis]|nr:hypothetical protein [Rhodococcus sp. 3A]
MGGQEYGGRVWRFPVFEEARAVPGAPPGWAAALVAVSRDLRCCHRGGPVRWDGACWELAVHPDGVVLAWNPAPPGISRPGKEPDAGAHDKIGAGRCVLGRGLASSLPAGEATIWVANTVQAALLWQLRVQWPCRDDAAVWVPRIRHGHPSWVDPSDERAVTTIGDLARAVTGTGTK